MFRKKKKYALFRRKSSQEMAGLHQQTVGDISQLTPEYSATISEVHRSSVIF